MFKRNIILFVLFFVGLFFVKNVFASGVSVRVNEIAWMGTEVSSNDEWIEIFNDGGSVVDLNGWILEAMDGSPKILLEGSVGAGGYFLLERTDDNSVGAVLADQIYSGALGNSGEVLVLKNQSGDEIDRVDAGGAWLKGDKALKLTMERDGQGGWQSSVSAGGTPGARNSEGGVQEEEVVVEEEDDDSSDTTAGIVSFQEKAEKLGYDYKKTIVISEVFPSPFGGHSDLEYVELFNYGEENISLKGWELGDESVMRYELKDRVDGFVIQTGSFLLIYRSESGIALNNSGDTVKLYQPFAAEAFTELKYGSASMGTSFGLVDFDVEKLQLDLLEYAWVETLSPGIKNFFVKKNSLPLVDFVCPDEIMIATPQIFDSSDTVDADGDELMFFWEFGDGATNTLAIPEHTFFEEGQFEVKFRVFDGKADVVKKKMIRVVDHSKPANKKAIQISSDVLIAVDDEVKIVPEFEDVLLDGFEKKEEYIFDVGSKVTILGIVAVLPGILGSQFFYVVESEESSVGIQVYNYKKDFPVDLKVGDLIEVVGEIVETKGEKRIKTKVQDDMRIVSTGHAVLSQEIIIKEINDNHIGNLVTVNGEVVERKSTYVYVDDGTDEIKVYIKATTGISSKMFTEGEEAQVTGILSKTSTGFRLMPRFMDDVDVSEDSSEEVDETYKENSEEGKVLGATVERDEWYVEARDSNNELYQYLLVICGAVIFVLLVLLFRARKE